MRRIVGRLASRRWLVIAFATTLMGALLVPVAGAADEAALGPAEAPGFVSGDPWVSQAEVEVAAGPVGAVQVEPEPEAAGQGLASGMVEAATGWLAEFGAPSAALVAGDPWVTAAESGEAPGTVARSVEAAVPTEGGVPIQGDVRADGAAPVETATRATTRAAAAPEAPAAAATPARAAVPAVPAAVPEAVAGDPWLAEAASADDGRSVEPPAVTAPFEAVAGAAPGGVREVADPTGGGVAAVVEAPLESSAEDEGVEPFGGGDARAGGERLTGDRDGTPSVPPLPGLGFLASLLGSKGAASDHVEGDLVPAAATESATADRTLVPHEQVPGLMVPPGLESARAVDVTHAQAAVDALKACGDEFIDVLATHGELEAVKAGYTCTVWRGALHQVHMWASSVLEPEPRRFVVRGDADDVDQWWTCEQGGACERFDPRAFPPEPLHPGFNTANAHIPLELYRQLFDIVFTDNPNWWPVRHARGSSEASDLPQRLGRWAWCDAAEDGISHCVDGDYVKSLTSESAQGLAIPNADAVVWREPSDIDDVTLRHERRHASQFGLLGDGLGGQFLYRLLKGVSYRLAERELNQRAKDGHPIEVPFLVMQGCFDVLEIGAGLVGYYELVCVPYWDQVTWFDGRPVFDVRSSFRDAQGSRH